MYFAPIWVILFELKYILKYHYFKYIVSYNKLFYKHIVWDNSLTPSSVTSLESISKLSNVKFFYKLIAWAKQIIPSSPSLF